METVGTGTNRESLIVKQKSTTVTISAASRMLRAVWRAREAWW